MFFRSRCAVIDVLLAPRCRNPRFRPRGTKKRATWHSSFADGKREVVGARNLDTLRARLEPVLLRRVRSECCPSFRPGRTLSFQWI